MRAALNLLAGLFAAFGAIAVLPALVILAAVALGAGA